MTRILDEGNLGIDTNDIIDTYSAGCLVKHGYNFALRYIPRVSVSTSIKHDLTKCELDVLRGHSLWVMPVQHVESETSWLPNADKGSEYGRYAGSYADSIGIEKGTNVWMDLEGVGIDVNSSIIIEYCNNWHDIVAEYGYKPGLYVGWRAGLSPIQLYKNLKFTSYWGAYNLNNDQFPATRGLCMKQSLPKLAESLDIPNINFNKDIVFKDFLGNYPTASG